MKLSHEFCCELQLRWLGFSDLLIAVMYRKFMKVLKKDTNFAGLICKSGIKESITDASCSAQLTGMSCILVKIKFYLCRKHYNERM